MTTINSSRRWARDEDVDRLPHGMVRTGYDADVEQYWFSDTTTGVQYCSAPGDAYGTLLPMATASYPKLSRGRGRRRTLQAYDRPVLFADDQAIGTPSHSPSRSRSHTPSRGHSSAPPSPPPSYHSRRHTTFEDFLPPHLIGTSPTSPVKRTRQRTPSPAPSVSSEPPPSPGLKEKWASVSPTAMLPELSLSQPSESASRDHPDKTPARRATLRDTARVLGRTLEAVKAHRFRGRERGRDGWVVV